MIHLPLLRHVLLAFHVLALFSITLVPALARDWQAGDRVQGYDVDWYDATIIEVGTGDHADNYLVKYDRYTTEKWLNANSIRARPNSIEGEDSAATNPQLGRYACYGYSGSTGNFRWYLDLGDTTYQQHIPDLAAGHYGYSAANSALVFIDGPYADNGWFGRLQESGGRREIVLRAVADEQQGPRVNEYSNIYCSHY